MHEQQRIELSKHEVASIASTGLWFEIILMQLLARYAYHRIRRTRTRSTRSPRSATRRGT